MRSLLTLVLACACYVLSAQNQYYTITFANDATIPDAKGKEALNLVTAQMSLNSENIERIEITGFTDTIGSESYNVALSRKRAEYVKSVCLSTSPVLADSIKLQWYGEGEGNTSDFPWQQRSVLITIVSSSTTTQAQTLSTTQIIAAMKEFGPKPEYFQIPQNKDTTLIATKGTLIEIPEDCFEIDPEDRFALITIEITEYYTYSDLIFGGLPTTTVDALLETGGSVNINAHIKNKTLKIKPDKKIKIGFASKIDRPNFQLFKGEINTNGLVSWLPTGNRINKYYKYSTIDLKPKSDFVTASDNPCPFFFCGIAQQFNWLFKDNSLGRPNLTTFDQEGYMQYLESLYTQFKVTNYSALQKAIKKWNREAEETATYLVEVGELGTINCDQFYSYPPSGKTSVLAATESLVDQSAFLVFHKLNSVMQPNSFLNNMPGFYNIGKGNDCTLVMIKISGEDYYVSLQNIITGETLTVVPSYSKMTKDEFLEAISGLNKYQPS